MATVKIEYPNLPDDASVEVLHLGTFANNETSDVSDEQVAQWVLHTGQEWPGELVIPPLELVQDETPVEQPTTEAAPTVIDEPKVYTVGEDN